MYSFRLDRVAMMLIAVLAFAASGASAQSQADLRRENQRLRTEVGDLEQELEAVQRRIEELEAEIDRLRSMPANGTAASRGPGMPVEPEPVTIDESVPEASPRALLRELTVLYQEELGEMPPGAGEDDPDRLAYMRALRHWVAKVNRDFRMPIEWFVTLESQPQPRDRGAVVRVQAVDPETAYKLGEQFPVFLPRSLVMRLQQREYDWEEVMVMRGVLVPQVQIDPERVHEGIFNSPPFIGPFAEFEIAAEAQTLLPKDMVVEEEEERGDDEGGQEPDRR